MPKPSKGFLQLTTAEAIVLQAFSDHPTIAYPVDCYGLSKEEVAEALKGLAKKQLIQDHTPYTLTKKGKHYFKRDLLND